MTNNEIAIFLYEISEMLEIMGESRFRIVAYQQAARTTENLTEDLLIFIRKKD